ncbi:rCG30011 [Rattus norvegicus]|uniref:RCG30011 n=1 Tax=Rattus norvegicus TaxID=10116 RepID=A6IL61_RAT|nr:rCG30011 [Rattus norvegicus]
MSTAKTKGPPTDAPWSLQAFLGPSARSHPMGLGSDHADRQIGYCSHGGQLGRGLWKSQST